jgi:hypothetical protein
MKIIEYIFNSVEKWYNVSMKYQAFNCGCLAIRKEKVGIWMLPCMDHMDWPESENSAPIGARVALQRERLFNRLFNYCADGRRQITLRKRKKWRPIDFSTLSGENTVNKSIG